MTLELQKNYIIIILIGWWHCMNVYYHNLFISNFPRAVKSSRQQKIYLFLTFIVSIKQKLHPILLSYCDVFQSEMASWGKNLNKLLDSV